MDKSVYHCGQRVHSLARLVALKHHDVRVGGSISGLGSFNTVTNIKYKVKSPCQGIIPIRYKSVIIVTRYKSVIYLGRVTLRIIRSTMFRRKRITNVDSTLLHRLRSLPKIGLVYHGYWIVACVTPATCCRLAANICLNNTRRWLHLYKRSLYFIDKSYIK